MKCCRRPPPDRAGTDSKEFADEESSRRHDTAAALAPHLIAEPALERMRARDKISEGLPESAPVAPPTARKDESAVPSRMATSAGGSSRDAPMGARTAPTSGADTDFGFAAASPVAKQAASAGMIGPPYLRVIYQLRPDGDTVDDLVRLLRREGADDIAVSVLEPRAVRAAFAPHRGRTGSLPEPVRGWMVTGSVPPSALGGLLDALAGRTGLRILEQSFAPSAPGAPPPVQRDLRITVLH